MSLVALGLRYRRLLDGPLRALGLLPLYLPDAAWADPRLAGHADLSLFRAGERVWLAPSLSGTEIDTKLREYGYSVQFLNYSPGKAYPRDAALNLMRLGKRLLYAPRASDPDIVKFLTNSEGDRPLPVRQGYIRCSCLPVDEESLITADPGIAAACDGAGLQVLRIRAGHVSLPGFPYGFLGGAGFLLDRRRLALTGSLDAHPDQSRIRAFLDRRGIEPVILTREPVFDIGGAFVLESLRKGLRG